MAGTGQGSRENIPANRKERQEDRQEWADKSREDRQAAARERQEDRQDYVDDKYDDHWDHHHHWHHHDGDFAAGVIVGGAIAGAAKSTSTTYVTTLPCSATAVVVNGVSYYNCSSVWYQRGHAGSQVTYIVVDKPPGH